MLTPDNSSSKMKMEPKGPICLPEMATLFRSTHVQCEWHQKVFFVTCFRQQGSVHSAEDCPHETGVMVDLIIPSIGAEKCTFKHVRWWICATQHICADRIGWSLFNRSTCSRRCNNKTKKSVGVNINTCSFWPLTHSRHYSSSLLFLKKSFCLQGRVKSTIE